MSSTFLKYRLGLRNLREILQSHPHISDVLLHRLEENLELVDRFGDNENRRSERYEILDQLNEFTSKILKKKFYDLYTSKSTEEEVVHTGDEVDEIDEPKMIMIPSGPFIMGSIPQIDKDAENNESPIHIVNLSKFSISRTCITNAQYALFIADTNYKPPTYWPNERPLPYKRDHPVVNVSWHDAISFCYWLSDLTQKAYSLPTEAQWEKAARGEQAFIYPWGYDWQINKANTLESRNQNTVSVFDIMEGQSPYGILQMAGNVFEWTSTIWGRDNQQLDFFYPYGSEDGREKIDTNEPVYRIVRGGAFNTRHENARCAARHRYISITKRSDIGFRVVTLE